MPGSEPGRPEPEATPNSLLLVRAFLTNRKRKKDARKTVLFADFRTQCHYCDLRASVACKSQLDRHQRGFYAVASLDAPNGSGLAFLTWKASFYYGWTARSVERRCIGWSPSNLLNCLVIATSMWCISLSTPRRNTLIFKKAQGGGTSQ